MGRDDNRGFPYRSHPTGWFQMGWSADFPEEQAQPLTLFSQELVAYRGASGTIRVFDAFCPHFGAHLGHGGCVEGDDIICPFHGWRFDGDGANVEVPYSSRGKTANRLASWTVFECDGLVFVWHDSEGGPPRWDPPTALGDQAVYPRDTLRTSLRMFPQMMVENAADLAHLKYVHRARTVPELESVQIEGPVFRNRAVYPAGGHLTNELNGVGIARSEFRDVFAGIDGGLVLTGATPTYGEHSAFFVSFWVLRSPDETVPEDPDEYPAPVKRFYDAQRTQGDPDWRIWENMRWNDRPATTPEEREVFRSLRQWAKQFYPDAYNGESFLAEEHVATTSSQSQGGS